MTEIWQWLTEYILGNAQLLNFILIGSVISLLASFFLIPLVIAKIPADYFSDEHRKPYAPKNLLLYILYKILKNVFGLLLVLLGFVLLFTPGQGLICILVASVMMDYPGKFRFQRYLVSKKPLLKSLNWVRKIAGAGPLEI